MPVIHAMLNEGFIGDTESIRAIAAKLSSEQTVTEFYQDSATDVVSLVEAKLDGNEQHILLISGTHGLDFLNKALKNPKIEKFIKDKQLIISWSGHQPPKNLKTLESNLTVVSLLQESIKPSIRETFGSRLIATKMVPNTLSTTILTTALADWRKKYPNPEDSIPDSANGYIGVILGGDAPDEDKDEEEAEHKCLTAKEARELGESFGGGAKRSGNLLVTNGPRMGKIYPESPDLKHPVLTRFNDKGWVPFADLSESEKTNDTAPEFKAHASKAPLDPVSAAFIAGIEASGLSKEQYRFIDFRFGKSAYQAIIATLYANKDNSMACYSGESISYAEISFFIPDTLVFQVGSMSNLHVRFLARISKELQLVGLLKLNKDKVKATTINQAKKQQTLSSGIDQDAQIIAAAILARVLALQTGEPLTWMASRKTPVKQADEELSVDSVEDKVEALRLTNNQGA